MTMFERNAAKNHTDGLSISKMLVAHASILGYNVYSKMPNIYSQSNH